MTTIKLIPQAMEFDVSIDAASMPSLFAQSMETTIFDEVSKQVEGRIPSEENIIDSVTETLKEDRDFGRKIRDWVMESLDYSDIAQSVASDIDYSQLVDEMISGNDLFESDNFVRNLLDNNRMKSMVDNAIARNLSTSTISDILELKMQEHLAAISVEAADKAIKIIMQRVSRGDDE